MKSAKEILNMTAEKERQKIREQIEYQVISQRNNGNHYKHCTYAKYMDDEFKKELEEADYKVEPTKVKYGPFGMCEETEWIISWE